MKGLLTVGLILQLFIFADITIKHHKNNSINHYKFDKLHQITSLLIETFLANKDNTYIPSFTSNQ